MGAAEAAPVSLDTRRSRGGCLLGWWGRGRGGGLQPVGGLGRVTRPCWEQEARLAEHPGMGVTWGTPPQPQHLCPGAPTQLPERQLHSAGEGCSCQVVIEGCTWIPEGLGNPVQTWVVRGEHGSDSSTPQGPDQTTQPSRVNHFEVMGFRVLWQAEGVTWREGAGQEGWSLLASG